MKIKLPVYRIFLLLSILPSFVFALSDRELRTAAETFRAERLAPRAETISAIEPFTRQDKLLGYSVQYSPEGFALFRADTNLAPLKLYAEQGSFTSLPPNFVHVMAVELSDELNALDALREHDALPDHAWPVEWSRLLQSAPSNSLSEIAHYAAADAVGPLVVSAWNQGSDYNLFCPSASGGPDGKAWAGCVAAAMAQIMKYHEYPPVGNGLKIYQDQYGSCQGWHTGSFSQTTYAWSQMPVSINSGTSQSQIDAVARLMYHAGIAVSMNYEADGSGAYSRDVPKALRNYFSYDCLDLSSRPRGESYEPWYSRLRNEIENNRPVYYSFMDTTFGVGHAVVVDGCRNGSEIHINMGWGGAGTAWYDLNDISYGAYDFNSGHDAVFGICRKGELDDKYEPNELSSSAYDISDMMDHWLSQTSNGPGVQANDDWYSVSVTEAPVTLMITSSFQNIEGNIEMMLFKGATQVAASRTTNNGESIVYDVQDPGTYYIKLDSNNAAGYPYVKIFWLNQYDLMYTIPEAGSMCVFIFCAGWLIRRWCQWSNPHS